LSDGQQQVDFAIFDELMNGLPPVLVAMNRTL
jgi:hypothetical protein